MESIIVSLIAGGAVMDTIEHLRLLAVGITNSSASAMTWQGWSDRAMATSPG